MIKLENYDVVGWEHAIRGMRNPMNSWDRSDSANCLEQHDCDNCPAVVEGHCARYEPYPYVVGPNDHELMMKLAKGGPVHAKYRRMIIVYVDITAPLYWWKEFDTYKVGTVANSCSTMHKIHAKEFTLEDFSHEHLFLDEDDSDFTKRLRTVSCQQLLMSIIAGLNASRNLFLETKDKAYWHQMIQLLPTSYNQKRTVQLNYEVLHNIYISRKNHKLDEWREMCAWIEKLPYSEIITGEEAAGDGT